MGIVTPVQLGYLLVFTTMWWLLSSTWIDFIKGSLNVRSGLIGERRICMNGIVTKTSKVSPSRPDFDLLYIFYLFVCVDII